jgi:hypothetical protein
MVELFNGCFVEKCRLALLGIIEILPEMVQMPCHRAISRSLAGLVHVDFAGRIHCISGILYASRASFTLSV